MQTRRKLELRGKKRCGSACGGGISSVMSVNTHSVPPHRYKAHVVCFGVISFPNMERDRNPSCHSSLAARLPSASHAGDVYVFSLVSRWKCMTQVRLRTCGSGRQAFRRLCEQKEKGLQWHVAAYCYARVECSDITQKVCIVTNPVAMVTKSAWGGWDDTTCDRHTYLWRRKGLKLAEDSVASLTLGSAVSSLKASYTCLSLTPPPRSRKLAGFPPCRSMMSQVAMAKPAPFTGKTECLHDDDYDYDRP